MDATAHPSTEEDLELLEQRRWDRLQRAHRVRLLRGNQCAIEEFSGMGGLQGRQKRLLIEVRIQVDHRLTSGTRDLTRDVTLTSAVIREHEEIIDTDSNATIEFREEPTGEQLFHALSLGLRDYLRKCGFKSAVLGLSGGIDSAVVAAIARECDARAVG